MTGAGNEEVKSADVDGLSVVGQLLERIDPDAQVHIGKFLGHLPVAGGGFDPAVNHGLVETSNKAPEGIWL